MKLTVTIFYQKETNEEMYTFAFQPPVRLRDDTAKKMPPEEQVM